MNKASELEKSADLWRDNSFLSVKLQRDLEAIGISVNVHLSGSDKPVLDYNGHFYQGGEIHDLIDQSRKDLKH